jgi:ribosomal protein S18 acetylase RimI-like enzyme
MGTGILARSGKDLGDEPHECLASREVTVRACSVDFQIPEQNSHIITFKLLTTNSMYIHLVTLQDLSALVKLFDAYRVFYEKESDPLGVREFLSERISRGDSVIFVATDPDGTMMGFVQLYPLFSSTRMKKLWLLNDLYVAPEFRGRQVSVMLIDRAKQLAEETNAAGLTLETAKSNSIGNNLYLKTGFEMDTEHNFYSWSKKTMLKPESPLTVTS